MGTEVGKEVGSYWFISISIYIYIYISIYISIYIYICICKVQRCTMGKATSTHHFKSTLIQWYQPHSSTTTQPLQ